MTQHFFSKVLPLGSTEKGDRQEILFRMSIIFSKSRADSCQIILSKWTNNGGVITFNILKNSENIVFSLFYF